MEKLTPARLKQLGLVLGGLASLWTLEKLRMRARRRAGPGGGLKGRPRSSSVGGDDDDGEAGLFIKARVVVQGSTASQNGKTGEIIAIEGRKVSVRVDKTYETLILEPEQLVVKKRVTFKRLKKALSRLLPIVIPSWKSKEALLLATHTLVLLSRTFLSIYVHAWDGKIVKSIVNRDMRQFLLRLLGWLALAFPATFINSQIRYLESKLALAFRTKLVKHAYGKYMSNDTYYAIENLDDRIRDVDQCLTQDIQNFSDSVAHIYSHLTKPMFDMVMFALQLTMMGRRNRKAGNAAGAGGTDSLGWSMTAAVFGGTYLILKLASPNFGEIVEERSARAGALRTTHTRLIQHAESVAFFRGHRVELASLRLAYHRLREQMSLLFKKRIFYTALEQFLMKYTWSALGLTLIALPMLRGESVAQRVAGGGVVDADAASERTAGFVVAKAYLMGFSDAVERIFSSNSEINELAGYAARVENVLHVMEEIGEGRHHKTLVKGADPALLAAHGTVVEDTKTGVIECDHLPIVTPNGDVLLDDLTMRIRPGDHLLIVGPNGCGKSSFFRTLGGLWPVRGGQLTRPPLGAMFYIPQRPHLTNGTLREQVTYPDTLEVFRAKHRSDAVLEHLLDDVGLQPLYERHPWDETRDWYADLSGGDKQRLAMARLFYHKPRYAVLDECTSAVSGEIEAKFYVMAKQHGITLLTVSHRPSLWKYHSYVLRFLGQKKYVFERLDEAAMEESLGEERARLQRLLKEAPAKEQRLRTLCRQLGESSAVLNALQKERYAWKQTTETKFKSAASTESLKALLRGDEILEE